MKKEFETRQRITKKENNGNGHGSFMKKKYEKWTYFVYVEG